MGVQAASAEAPMVRLGVVDVKTVPVYAEFVGQTDAKETVNIVPRVTGFLEKVFFKEGSEIHKGDVLFQIEQASYKAALEQAQAKLAQDNALLIRYQRDIGRLEPLVKEQAATQQDLDVAIAGSAQQRAAMQADQAAIDTANLNLSYTTISSPIDGLIGKLNVTPGNLLTAGQQTILATISSFDPIYVYFSIPEASYLAFRKKYGPAPPRDQLELLLSDGSPFKNRGSIDFADRIIDPQTGTLMIRAIYKNQDALLRPGEFGRVRFIIEQRPNAVLVPKEAVTETLNMKGVLVVDAANRATLKTITTDGEYENFFVVHSGLTGGEKVVVEGVQKVHPGATVNPIPAAVAKGK